MHLHAQVCVHITVYLQYMRTPCAWRIAIHKAVQLAHFLSIVTEMARTCTKVDRCMFSGGDNEDVIHTYCFQRVPVPLARLFAAETRTCSQRKGALLPPFTSIWACAQTMYHEWGVFLRVDSRRLIFRQSPRKHMRIATITVSSSAAHREQTSGIIHR